MRGWLTGLLLSLAAPALAGPFAPTGDQLFRDDVELMHARGLINGPMDSWPLPWAQIERGLDAAGDGRTLTPEVAAAVARVEAINTWATEDVNYEVRAAATNSRAIARPFEESARAQGDASGRVEANFGRFTVALGAGLRPGQRGNAYHFEPSYAAATFGNWVAYGGWVQQHFGPGEDGALLFSLSARPFPKVGIKVLDPRTIQLPVLRWLGPIRFEIFAGLLDEKRDAPDQAIVGTRLSIAPFRGYQVSLNRMQQFCGRGRPCNARVVADSFFGAFRSGSTPVSEGSPLQRSGNQMAGFDMSYTQRIGRVSAKFYLEAEAEDFSGFLLEQWGRLAGLSVTGPIGERGARWKANLEYTDTVAAQLLAGTPLDGISGDRLYPGSFYNNNAYPDGFAYFRRPIGHWSDSDSRNLAVTGSYTDPLNRRHYLSVRDVRLNISPFGRDRVSQSREALAIVTAGSVWPTSIGDVKAEVRYQSDSPDTPAKRVGRVQFEVGIRQRF